MEKKKTPFGRRAWNLLRLAFLWARKGGVFKSRLVMDLRLLPNYIKSLCHNPSPDRIHYRERQFSFDETPLFHFKMQRPASMRFRVPCLNPPSVDFDFDFDDDVLFNNNQYHNGRKSFLLNGKEEEEEEEENFNDCDSGDHGRTSSAVVSCREEILEDDEGGGGEIDVRAEEFIAKFYEQIKLQRQISYIQYHDMLNRGAS